MSDVTIYLIRHGQTQWSLNGKHTGLTDIPLTEEGKKEAASLQPKLASISFDAIFVSPLIRVQETLHLALPDASAQLCEHLLEWDYGKYEGITTKKIHKTDPDWSIFSKGAPEGESLEAVTKRVDTLLAMLAGKGKTIALFTSGHISRAIMARWVGQPVSFGAHLLSSTASVSQLSFERQNRVIKKLNDTSHYE